MLFNSAVFLLLFALAYLLYWHLSLRWKHAVITLTSLIFYAWYSLGFLVLFLLIIGINFYLSNQLIKNKSRLLLWIGLTIDLGNLAFFKYFYLFAEGIGSLIGNEYVSHLRLNWRADHDFEIFLPIAISFYTFQVIAYLVDSYRGTVSEKVSFRRYFLFIMFFPQFIAGPIMRSGDFIPQIDNPRPTLDRTINGCLLLMQGTVKKVLIADRLGALIGPVYANPEGYDATTLIFLTPAFAAQVYADFSGYTDMARGMAHLMGYDIPENFRAPYLARTTGEFWRRWHITLSSWLRDYIYIPLGGSRVGTLRSYFNLVLTMALGGLWHGADWTMLLWGTFIGVDLVVERFMDQRGIRVLPEGRLADRFRILITFFKFCLGLLLFASPSLDQFVAIVQGLLTWQRGIPVANFGAMLGLSVAGILWTIPQGFEGLRTWLHTHRNVRLAFSTVGVFVVGLLVSLYGDASGSFIYFQF
ncbi:MAG: MBOAT family protein [Spirochaetales bacterium]|nr:MBOAT family protein [Spirochaetales bacterium]